MAKQGGNVVYNCDRCGRTPMYGELLFRVIFGGYEEEWCRACLKAQMGEECPPGRLAAEPTTGAFVVRPNTPNGWRWR